MTAKIGQKATKTKNTKGQAVAEITMPVSKVDNVSTCNIVVSLIRSGAAEASVAISSTSFARNVSA